MSARGKKDGRDLPLLLEGAEGAAVKKSEICPVIVDSITAACYHVIGYEHNAPSKNPKESLPRGFRVSGLVVVISSV
jgi:hypothetical protein